MRCRRRYAFKLGSEALQALNAQQPEPGRECPRARDCGACLILVVPDCERCCGQRRQIRECPLANPLSSQERRVLGLLALGLTRSEVARQLHLSPHTVNTHVEHIYGKLCARNVGEAVRVAMEGGIVLEANR